MTLSIPPPLEYGIDNGYSQSLVILAYRNPCDLGNCIWKQKETGAGTVSLLSPGLSLPLFDCVAVIGFSSYYSSSFYFKSAILGRLHLHIKYVNVQALRKKTVQHHTLFDGLCLADRSGRSRILFSLREEGKGINYYTSELFQDLKTSAFCFVCLVLEEYSIFNQLARLSLARYEGKY